MTIRLVRAEIAKALRTIPELVASEYVPDSVDVPHAVVAVKEIDYRLVLSDSAAVIPFTVSIYVGRNDGAKAQETLDRYCDPSDAWSVLTLLHGWDALQGRGAASVCDYAEVVKVTGPTPEAIGTVPYLIVDFDVEVCIS